MMRDKGDRVEAIEGRLLFRYILVTIGNPVRHGIRPVYEFLLVAGGAVRYHRRLLLLRSMKVVGRRPISNIRRKRRMMDKSSLLETTLGSHRRGIRLEVLFRADCDGSRRMLVE